MKKSQKIIAIGLACFMLGTTISLVACSSKPRYACATCQDTSVIACSCGGGRCLACRGMGRDDSRKCDFCKGKGRVWDGENINTIRDCSFCKGFGSYTCLFCDGTGWHEYCTECDNGKLKCPDCSTT